MRHASIRRTPPFRIIPATGAVVMPACFAWSGESRRSAAAASIGTNRTRENNPRMIAPNTYQNAIIAFKY